MVSMMPSFSDCKDDYMFVNLLSNLNYDFVILQRNIVKRNICDFTSVSSDNYNKELELCH